MVSVTKSNNIKSSCLKGDPLNLRSKRCRKGWLIAKFLLLNKHKIVSKIHKTVSIITNTTDEIIHSL